MSQSTGVRIYVMGGTGESEQIAVRFEMYRGADFDSLAKLGQMLVGIEGLMLSGDIASFVELIASLALGGNYYDAAVIIKDHDTSMTDIKVIEESLVNACGSLSDAIALEMGEMFKAEDLVRFKTLKKGTVLPKDHSFGNDDGFITLKYNYYLRTISGELFKFDEGLLWHYDYIAQYDREDVAEANAPTEEDLFIEGGSSREDFAGGTLAKGDEVQGLLIQSTFFRENLDGTWDEAVSIYAPAFLCGCKDCYTGVAIYAEGDTEHINLNEDGNWSGVPGCFETCSEDLESDGYHFWSLGQPSTAWPASQLARYCIRGGGHADLFATEYSTTDGRDWGFVHSFVPTIPIKWGRGPLEPEPEPLLPPLPPNVPWIGGPPGDGTKGTQGSDASMLLDSFFGIRLTRGKEEEQ